ncbi:hypothetical protein Ahy_B09g098793 [Arachis hypogaea]|uniref:Zinc finger GRF-type domain-containing protein n=1 Tax=Arachis hypogaea TaxID=3818 RepID=A0A444XS30_ARAHY|nr:hypothetical protein Ahy_B09g098793 [Arachis hypogaea]
MPLLLQQEIDSAEAKIIVELHHGQHKWGRSRSLSQSHGSNASSSSPRLWRKNMDQVCFCGLKTVIKKSGTVENPDRLFYACPRYRAENIEYEGLDGAKTDGKTDAEMESDLVVLQHNLSWKMMSLEAEVRALRIKLYFGLIVVIVVVMITCMFFSVK